MMINIRSQSCAGAEVSWFAPICNGDTDYLGEMSNAYKSNWTNASRIALRADAHGYKNMLCPSSYQVGQDTWSFVSALAPQLEQMSLLAAIRSGEVHPAMLARAIATVDHIMKGRLTLNIISSNLPGESLSSADRYTRSREVVEILRQAWTQDEIHFKGAFYQLELPAKPVKPYQQNGGPLLYFGGYSPAGLDLCAQHCDVYLMWPETAEVLSEQMRRMSDLANAYDRTVDFGLRVHMIVRKTEAEAKQYAQRLMSKLDTEKGKEIRERALDAKSLGVAKQASLRDRSDSEGYAEEHLWTGIGRARSGCGAALVGDPDQILQKLQSYMDLGIRSFILSGYPHLQECDLFAKYVLPRIPNISLPSIQNRIPISDPVTPLGIANRS